jgi:hypothetical protein
MQPNLLTPLVAAATANRPIRPSNQSRRAA